MEKGKFSFVIKCRRVVGPVVEPDINLHHRKKFDHDPCKFKLNFKDDSIKKFTRESLEEKKKQYQDLIQEIEGQIRKLGV